MMIDEDTPTAAPEAPADTSVETQVTAAASRSASKNAGGGAEPPGASREEKAHQVWKEILAVDFEKMDAELINGRLQAETAKTATMRETLQEVDFSAATAIPTIMAIADEIANMATRACAAKEDLAAKLNEFARQIRAASQEVLDAESAAHAAMAAKRQTAKKEKEAEVDPLECKYWISWDSMYRRTKMGRWLGLTTATDTTAKLWDFSKGVCTGTLAGDGDNYHEAAVRCAAMDLDTKRCVTGALDGTLFLWSTETCELKECFISGKYGAMLCIDADWTRKKLLTATGDGIVCIWDSDKLFVKDHWAAHEGERIIFAKADFQKNRAVTCSQADGRMRVWDIEYKQCIANFHGNGGPTASAQIDFKGKRVLSGSEEGDLYLWDLETGAEIAVLNGHEDKVNALQVDPKFQRALSVSEDGTMRSWNLTKRTSEAVFTGHAQGIRDVRADWKTDRIVTCSDDTTLRVWNGKTQSCEHIFEGHMDRVTALRARFDRDMVASISDDYTVRTWDLQMMQEEGVLYGHSGAVKCLVAVDKGSDDPEGGRRKK